MRHPISSTAATVAALLLISCADTSAQTAAPADVATPEAIIAASYESLIREPGEPFDWERFESLFAPGALLVPNTEQTGGESLVMTVAGFRRWVDNYYAENAPIGAPGDKGFAEEQIHAVSERYGDVVQVMSTYSKRFWDADDVLGRGINAMTLVHNDGRWWILSNAWDEENGAGPLPPRYLPSGGAEATVGAAGETAVTATPADVRTAEDAGDPDFATPEALMEALYDTFQRRPGETIDWERFAALYLPEALLVPNVEQTGGDFRIMSVKGFEEWIEGIFAEHSPIGSPEDHGLAEDEAHSVMQRYGDVAQVMSTYERHAWDSDEIDGRGINAITLVRQDGRWWILSVAWDEESGAGPIPDRYMAE